jgi:hypothetical protein
MSSDLNICRSDSNAIHSPDDTIAQAVELNDGFVFGRYASASNSASVSSAGIAT